MYKQFSDHEVAESLINLSNYKIENCPLYKKNPEKFEHLLVFSLAANLRFTPRWF